MAIKDMNDSLLHLNNAFGKWDQINPFISHYWPVGSGIFKRAVVIGRTESGNKLIVIEVLESSVE